MYGLPNQKLKPVFGIFSGTLALLTLLHNPLSPLNYEAHPVLRSPTSCEVCESGRVAQKWDVSIENMTVSPATQKRPDHALESYSSSTCLAFFDPPRKAYYSLQTNRLPVKKL